MILGCGYAGERLARRLVDEGEDVVATARTDERVATLRTLGLVAERLDVTAPDGLAALVRPGAVVVDSVPPGPAPHAHGVVAAAARGGARRIVILSTTGVYARGAPGRPLDVDEDTPAVGETTRGGARLAIERAYAEAGAAHGVETVALRIPAIHGPGRGVGARLAAGTYRVIGDGTAIVSRIHVDDLVSAIVRAGRVEPLARGVYVVGDDEPAPTGEVADGLAARLGLPPPPRVPVGDVPPEAAEMALSNRRALNARMKRELGVTLRHPTWRDGA